METEEKVKECFKSAKKDEERDKKHKGLLTVEPNQKKAKEYLERAKESLEFCDFYRKRGADYKIPEEWFYSLYYCALAILTKFGVESRSQRCTALFIGYLREKGLIEYDEEFINRIVVHKEKDKESDVDERERAKYGSWIKSDDVRERYDKMMNLSRKAISQCEEIVFSNEALNVPKKLIG
ncbi:MAG: hypothetical protein ABIB47_00545 [Candidatus Woesearchaeota archaeon]